MLSPVVASPDASRPATAGTLAGQTTTWQYGPVPLRLVYALMLADFVALTLACWPYPSPGREQGPQPYLK